MGIQIPSGFLKIKSNNAYENHNQAVSRISGSQSHTLEAGISYDLLEHLRLTGGFGGFRSVMTFYEGVKQYESANGPLLWLGADYLFLPEGKAIRPSASLNLGYRLAIPRASNSAEGAFLHAALGADFHLGGLSLNLSLTAELTQALRPAAGISLRILID